MVSNDRVQGQRYFGHCTGAFLGANKAEILYTIQSVTLDSEEIQDVSRCLFAMDVGGFAEPHKILYSLSCNIIDQS